MAKTSLPSLSFKNRATLPRQIDKLARLSVKDSKAFIAEMLRMRKPRSNDDLMVGNLVFTSYNAKDKDKVWDKRPMFLILSRSRGYTLGLNFHWLPVRMRIVLLKYIVALNKKKRKDEIFSIDYKDLKPFLKKHGYFPCIRLYINKRLGRNCVNIPHEKFPVCSVLETAVFSGVSSDKIYKSLTRKSIK